MIYFGTHYNSSICIYNINTTLPSDKQSQLPPPSAAQRWCACSDDSIPRRVETPHPIDPERRRQTHNSSPISITLSPFTPPSSRSAIHHPPSTIHHPPLSLPPKQHKRNPASSLPRAALNHFCVERWRVEEEEGGSWLGRLYRRSGEEERKEGWRVRNGVMAGWKVVGGYEDGLEWGWVG